MRRNAPKPSEINKSFCFSKENKLPKAQNNRLSQKRPNHSLHKNSQVEDSLEVANTLNSNTFGKTLKKNTKNLNRSMENQAERKTLKSKVNAPFEEIFEELSSQCHDLKREFSSDSSSEFEKGKEYFKLNNMPEALRHFQNANQMSPEFTESRYYIGVCLLNMKEYDSAQTEFERIIEEKPFFNLNIYLLLAIACKNLAKLELGIKYLSEAIEKFPNFYEALIYRAKLFVLDKKFQNAVEDFEKAIFMCPHRGIAYLGKADCLRFLGNFVEAVDLYNKVIELPDINRKTVILKRGLSYMEQGNFELSLQDLEELSKTEPMNSLYHYFKGLLYFKQGKLHDSLLCFEQCIKFNSCNNAVANAIFQIVMIKIEMRDFYSAYYTLNRFKYINYKLKKDVLEKFRIFIESVLLLMKRKFAEGNAGLTNLYQNHELGNVLKPLLLQYRAYGLFCEGKHENALLDYKTLESIQKSLDQSSTYNKLLLEGIRKFNERNYQESLVSFKSASSIYQNKSEPYFYSALTILKLAPKPVANDIDSLSQIISLLDKAFSCNSSYAPLLYMRALVKFSMRNLSEALVEIDQAIEKSEDNVPKYYYLRGLIYANATHYKNALEDFTITIQLDSRNSRAFLNRAKCYFLLGIKEKAFCDLKKFSEIRMKSSELHLWAGHFFLNDGAYSLASQAYTNSMSLKYKESILICRAKSNIMARELNAALDDLEKITEISQNNKARYDIQALMALKTSSIQSETDPIGSNGFAKSLESFSTLIVSKKQGIIFKFNDLFFYKGLMHFYLGQFEEALTDFHHAFEIKKVFCEVSADNSSQRDSLHELLEEFENEDSQIKDAHPKNEEMTDFSNNSFNIYEYYHNCMIVAIKMKNWKMALEFGKRLMEIIPKNFKANLSILLKCVEVERLMSEKKLRLEDVSEDLKTLEQIIVFPDNDRLSKIFPSFTLDFSFNLEMETKLSFCLPKVVIPNIEINYEEDLLVNLQNKPEAPWIKRTGDGIVFTDKVQVFHDLDLESEERSGEQENCKVETQINARYISINSEEENVSKEKIKGKKEILKDLKLDMEIEKKLQKIISRDQKQS